MTLLAMMLAAALAPAVQPTPSAPMSGPPAARPGATDALRAFDGVWIGEATMVDPTGTWRRFEQMERIGPMLAGEVRVMEGKARGPDGRTLFNALTVFSAVPGGIEMRSWTPGHAGARIIEQTPTGYSWRMQVGPRTIEYRITLSDGRWHEVGTLTAPGRPPTTIFEMTLRRVGDSDWPAANPQFPTRD